MKARELWSLSNRELARVLAEGDAVDPDALAGSSFRGVSLGLPRLLERLTWKTFRKSFRRTASGVDGLNVRLVQNGLDGTPTARTKRGVDVTFGPFAVEPLPADGTPFGCRAGAVFHYGKRHPSWHPMACVRDVVVALDDDTLLGALYLEIGSFTLRTPSYFTLERER
jgi:hypothetical protein